jgi:hypothetical protein
MITGRSEKRINQSNLLFESTVYASYKGYDQMARMMMDPKIQARVSLFIKYLSEYTSSPPHMPTAVNMRAFLV